MGYLKCLLVFLEFILSFVTLGSRADMASRAEGRLSRLNSAASSLQGPDKASVDEVRHDLLLAVNDKYLEMVTP